MTEQHMRTCSAAEPPDHSTAAARKPAVIRGDVIALHQNGFWLAQARVKLRPPGRRGLGAPVSVANTCTAVNRRQARDVICLNGRNATMTGERSSFGNNGRTAAQLYSWCWIHDWIHYWYDQITELPDLEASCLRASHAYTFITMLTAFLQA